MTTKELLEAPLPEEAVQRALKSQTHKAIDMTGFKYQYCVDRMNAVFGPDDWSLRFWVESVDDIKFGDKDAFEAVVQCTIGIRKPISDKTYTDIIEKQSFGGHQSFTRTDAIKGAQTDALKKCLAFFGVGADAYRGTIDEDYRGPDAKVSGEPTSGSRPAHVSRPQATVGDIILTFGKYKDKTLDFVFIHDQSYVDWLSKKAEDPDVKAAAYKLMNPAIEDEVPIDIEEIKAAIDGTEVPEDIAF